MCKLLKQRTTDTGQNGQHRKSSKGFFRKKFFERAQLYNRRERELCAYSVELVCLFRPANSGCGCARPISINSRVA